MTDKHPLDHDGDGKLGGSLPKAKRGRPAKVKVEVANEAKTAKIGTLKVKVPNAIFDGDGGFLPVGAAFDAIDAAAAEALKAKGLAE